MYIYFIIRENVDPNTRGILVNVPGFAKFYIQYFSLTDFFLVFEPDPSLVHPDFPVYKYKI